MPTNLHPVMAQALAPFALDAPVTLHRYCVRHPEWTLERHMGLPWCGECGQVMNEETAAYATTIHRLLFPTLYPEQERVG